MNTFRAASVKLFAACLAVYAILAILDFIVYDGYTSISDDEFLDLHPYKLCTPRLRSIQGSRDRATRKS